MTTFLEHFPYPWKKIANQSVKIVTFCFCRTSRPGWGGPWGPWWRLGRPLAIGCWAWSPGPPVRPSPSPTSSSPSSFCWSSQSWSPGPPVRSSPQSSSSSPSCSSSWSSQSWSPRTALPRPPLVHLEPSASGPASGRYLKLPKNIISKISTNTNNKTHALHNDIGKKSLHQNQVEQTAAPSNHHPAPPVEAQPPFPGIVFINIILIIIVIVFVVVIINIIVVAVVIVVIIIVIVVGRLLYHQWDSSS